MLLRITRFCATTLYWTITLPVLFVACAVLGLRHWALPKVAEYKPQIESRLSQALKAPVQIGEVQASWSSWRPELSLRRLSITTDPTIAALASGVAVGDPAATKRGGMLELERADVSLSIAALLRGDVQLHDLHLFAPRLEFVRDVDGRISLFGKVLNAPTEATTDTAMLEWLRAQPGIAIEQATIVWTDLMPIPGSSVAPSPLTLSDVNMRIQKDTGLVRALGTHDGSSRHRFALSAEPNQGLAAKVEVKGNVRVGSDLKSPQVWGELYMNALEADSARIKRYLPRGLVNERFTAALNGRGNLRSWAKFEPSRLTSATMDLAIVNAKVLVGETEKPIELASVDGRLLYLDDGKKQSASSERLALKLADGKMLTNANFSVAVELPDKAAARKVDLSFANIDLAVADALAGYMPIAPEVRSRIARFAPRGQVDRLQLSWIKPDAGAVESYSIDARLKNFALTAVDHYPGVKGLTATIKGNERAGSIDILSEKFQLDAPQVFAKPLAFDKFESQATWSVTESTPTAQQVAAANNVAAEYAKTHNQPIPPKYVVQPIGVVDVQLSSVRLESADVNLKLSGKYRTMPLALTGHYSPGFIDVKGAITNTKLARVVDLLPNSASKTRSYLEMAIEAGEVSNAPLELKGDLWDFPFEKGSVHEKGVFKVDAQLANGRFTYKPDWPKLDDIDGRLIFDQARLEVRADRLLTSNTVFQNVSAVIDSIASTKSRLTIDATANTAAKDVYAFLRNSPLKDGPGAFTEAVSLDGPGKLGLQLRIPLGSELVNETISVNGLYSFAQNTAGVGSDLSLKGLKGELKFTERGAESKALTGEMFGHPTTIDIKTEEQGVRTTVAGKIDGEDLKPFLAASLANKFSGTAPWQAEFATRDGGSELTVKSSLVGMGSTMPAPLAKGASDAMPLAVTIKRLGKEGETISASLGSDINSQMRRDAAGRISAVSVAMGMPAVEPREPGLHLLGRVASVDYDQWRAVGEAAASATSPATATAPQSGGLDLTTIDLAIDRLRFMGRDFNKMRAKIGRNKSGWEGALASPDVEGKLSWNGAAAGGKGAFKASFSKLYLDSDDAATNEKSSDKAGDAQKTVSAPQANQQAPQSLPQLDIVAEDFKFRGQWLGKLELAATPAEDNWRIDKLRIVTGHGTMLAQGGLRQTGSGPVTSLTIALESKNLNAVFNQFGYGDMMKRGVGKLSGQLNWPGYPYDFAVNQLYGEYDVDWEKGQFAKVEPGIGKLLGLISLQSIPRRLSLDFRDIFSDGFAFDSIRGKVKIARGKMLTDAFEINGPAAFITMSGEVSLPDETQQLRVRVVPEVSESVAIAAGIIGTPVIGLTTYLLQKILQNPLSKIVAYEYQITGSWDNPVVNRGNSGGAGATAPTQ